MITYKELHHVSLPVTNLERSKIFYREILGLEELDRPNFDFDGAWFQVGKQQIHLIVFPGSEMIRQKREISTRDAHLAVRVNEYDKALEWLKKHNVSFKENRYSKSGFAQIFCTDPDGHIIELNVDQKDL
ncbi:VOC family protein [Alkalihalobacterium chitinilyticum]|uniref:VOC family protein n=1 Tax=Alkalihalobacterium chitinilyticum TaxID=2980103 RepID=A0ABT5VGG3_9BACI|nr:VOC family protein [Alkalihalobacterium chitinilyticum]MDE5414550.1 VOC family protein [Alkalihalobacterium chitinilyticum]